MRASLDRLRRNASVVAGCGVGQGPALNIGATAMAALFITIAAVAR
ncbi:MAG: hypothetical protein ACE5HV_03560 [Acidobacteriota bacterium]